MRDSMGWAVFRWQVGVRLGDGMYTAPCRYAPTPKLAQVDVMRALRLAGRTGYRLEAYRQLRVDGTAAGEWVPIS